MLVILFGVFLVGVSGENRALLNSIYKDMFLHYFNETPEICPTCSQMKAFTEYSLGDNAIKEFRIEQIKKSILDSLDLNEVPIVEPCQLPRSFKNSSFMKQLQRSNNINKLMHIEKIFLLPRGVTCKSEAIGETDKLTINMKYVLPESVRPSDVTSVYVWLDKAGEVRNEMKGNSFIKFIPCGQQTNKLLKQQRIQSFNGDWIELDAMLALKSCLEKGKKYFSISLKMANWSNDYCKKIQTSEHKPFLSVHYKSNEQLPRLKRSHDCTKHSRECCRESLYVSFKDIGWDQFVVGPQGYEAYYCKGSCVLSTSTNRHGSVIQTLSAAGKNVTSCCGPTKLSSMEILFYDKNKIIRKATVSSSVVETCGCL